MRQKSIKKADRERKKLNREALNRAKEAEVKRNREGRAERKRRKLEEMKAQAREKALKRSRRDLNDISSSLEVDEEVDAPAVQALYLLQSGAPSTAKLPRPS